MSSTTCRTAARLGASSLCPTISASKSSLLCPLRQTRASTRVCRRRPWVLITAVRNGRSSASDVLRGERPSFGARHAKPDELPDSHGWIGAFRGVNQQAAERQSRPEERVLKLVAFRHHVIAVDWLEAGVAQQTRQPFMVDDRDIPSLGLASALPYRPKTR